MGPIVGRPEIVAAHGCQNMDGPRPAQPNRFHHLGLQCGALVPQEDNNYYRMLHFISKIIDNIGSSSFCLQCFDAVGWAAGRASGL